MARDADAVAKKKRGHLRVIDIDPDDIPPNCKHVVVTHNKTRVVIRTNTHQVHTSIENKHALLMKKIRAFFDEPAHFRTLQTVLLQKSPLSLRLLDWSVTNWARKHSVVLRTQRSGFEENVNMYLDYKSNLKAFSKKSFDPFCRRERIMLTFACDPSQAVYVSTPAQLNFMRWAIESGVIEYCERHVREIEADMLGGAPAEDESSRAAPAAPRTTCASLSSSGSSASDAARDDALSTRAPDAPGGHFL